MTKDALRTRTRVSFVLRTMGHGFVQSLFGPWWKWASLMLLIFLYAGISFFEFIVLPQYLSGIYQAANIVLFPFSFCLFLYGMGRTKETEKFYRNLLRIGFTNSAGEAPILISRTPDAENKIVTIYEFLICGLSLDFWEDNKLKLESALNLNIANIQPGKDNRRVFLYAVPGTMQLPKTVYWKPDFLSDDTSVLTLGLNLLGLEKINLDSVPHILIGGSTGSGKTVLVRSLLIQCLQHGHEVVVIDWKGIDFGSSWSERCDVIYDEDTLRAKLSAILDEMKRRKTLFRAAECSNIKEYNEKNTPLFHIIVACDEIASLFDTSGATKEQKQQMDVVRGYLSDIARQGRAFGVNLIIATQRPDANAVPGQIKNNIDCRVCGRADNVLSMIILDNTSADDEIPKDSQGRFILHDGTIIQGFLFDEVAELSKVPPRK